MYTHRIEYIQLYADDRENTVVAEYVAHNQLEAINALLESYRMTAYVKVLRIQRVTVQINDRWLDADISNQSRR